MYTIIGIEVNAVVSYMHVVYFRMPIWFFVGIQLQNGKFCAKKIKIIIIILVEL